MSIWDDPQEYYRQQRQQKQWEKERIQSEKDSTNFILFLLSCALAALAVAVVIIVVARFIFLFPNIHYIASFIFFYFIGIDLLYCGYLNGFSNCYDSYAFSTNATINILMLITFIHTLFLFKKIQRKAIKFHIISMVLAVMIQFFLQ